MSRTFKNAKKAEGLEGCLVRMRYGIDPMWTTAGRCGECYRYVLETWELLWGNSYEKGSTQGRVEVCKPDDAGWAVELFGEILPERYSDKGYAQCAAEDLIGVRF